MVMETHHIKDIHAQFKITPEGAKRWMFHFNNAMQDIDMGPRKDEIMQILNNWLELFAKSVINAPSGCPFS